MMDIHAYGRSFSRALLGMRVDADATDSSVPRVVRGRVTEDPTQVEIVHLDLDRQVRHSTVRLTNSFFQDFEPADAAALWFEDLLESRRGED